MTKQFESRTYPLNIIDAAKIGEKTIFNLRDLVVSGKLSCLVNVDPDGVEWFNLEDVRLARDILAVADSNSTDHRRAIQVGEVVRAYLEAHPPLADYNEAVGRSAPVLAKGAGGTIFAHVQLDTVAEFARDQDMGPLAQLPTSLGIGLKNMGARKVRGIRGLTGGDQKWHYWYRLPVTLWSVSPDLGTVLHTLGGVHEGAPFTRRSGGEPYLKNPIGATD